MSPARAELTRSGTLILTVEVHITNPFRLGNDDEEESVHKGGSE